MSNPRGLKNTRICRLPSRNGISRRSRLESLKPLKNSLRRIIRLYPNVAATLFGCIVVVALLVAAESFFRAKLWLGTRPGEGPAVSNIYEIAEPFPVLGYHAKASSSLVERPTRGGATIYTANYHTDSQSRRLAPLVQEGQRDCFAAFLGCSVTFGVGVEDAETLPAQFGKFSNAHQPLNYGFPGYGLQQVWLQLTDKSFVEKLPSGKGAVIYTFIDDHINRLVGTPAVLSGWNYALPWLVDENGQVNYMGTFRDRDPLRYYIYRYAGRMHVYRFLQNHLPASEPMQALGANAYDFAAHVIKDAADKLHKIRPEIQFCLLIFPDSGLGAEMRGRVESPLITFLDYSKLLEATGLPKDELWYRDSGATSSIVSPFVYMM